VHRPTLRLTQTAGRSLVEDGSAEIERHFCFKSLVGIQDAGHGWPPFTAVILRTSTTTHDWLAGTGCESALVMPLNFNSRLSAGTTSASPSAAQLLTASRSSHSTGWGAPVSTWK